MNTTLAHGLVALLVASATGLAQADSNLIANGGFETGDLTDWTATHATTGNSQNVGVDDFVYDVNSGNDGAYMGNAVATTLSQSVSTVSGAQYQLSFYLDVYQADAVTGYVDVSFAGRSILALVDPLETDNNPDPFTFYSFSVIADSSSSEILFSAANPPGFFGLDDISLVQTLAPPPVTTPVPEPSPLLLMLAGLASIGTLSKRRRRQ